MGIFQAWYMLIFYCLKKILKNTDKLEYFPMLGHRNNGVRDEYSYNQLLTF